MDTTKAALTSERAARPVMPAVFLSHGSPMVALEPGAYGETLGRLGSSLNPEAIVVISAHWEEPGVRINAAAQPALVYDFGGFPPPLYEMKYDAPGSPALASEIQKALQECGIAASLDTRRGWDHGLWIPLRLMFPEARIPVVEVSLPMDAAPEQLFKMGEALAAFRERGILIVGSGGLVHNLRLLHWHDKTAPVDAWAREFETWVREAVQRRDFQTLFQYRGKSPHAALAVPTPEHFAPLFAVLGAGGGYSGVETIFEGIEHGNLSMYCFALKVAR